MPLSNDQERQNAALVLTQLAQVCHNGACNPLAIINSLASGIQGMRQDEVRKSVQVKYIIGQLSFLLGESIGPSEATFEAYVKTQASLSEG